MLWTPKTWITGMKLLEDSRAFEFWGLFKCILYTKTWSESSFISIVTHHWPHPLYFPNIPAAAIPLCRHINSFVGELSLDCGLCCLQANWKKACAPVVTGYRFQLQYWAETWRKECLINTRLYGGTWFWLTPLTGLCLAWKRSARWAVLFNEKRSPPQTGVSGSAVPLHRAPYSPQGSVGVRALNIRQSNPFRNERHKEQYQLPAWLLAGFFFVFYDWFPLAEPKQSIFVLFKV